MFTGGPLDDCLSFCPDLSPLLQVNEDIPVKHLPASEPDPHVVRIGWSLNTCSTQLGEPRLLIFTLSFGMTQCHRIVMDSRGLKQKRALFCYVTGEEPFSYGYGGTGKKSSDCKFADYGEKFGENDVIGCYIVSS